MHEPLGLLVELNGDEERGTLEDEVFFEEEKKCIFSGKWLRYKSQFVM